MNTLHAILLAVAGLASASHAATTYNMESWRAHAAATSGVEVADATGWGFDGSGSVAFDFGNLGDGTSGNATVEIVLNWDGTGDNVGLAGFGAQVASGSKTGNYVSFKGPQYKATDKYGITGPGAADWSFDASVATGDIVLTFVNLGSTVTLYVNGVEAASMSATKMAFTGGAGFLGESIDKTGLAMGKEFFSGTIYGISTYNRALTATEIQSSYEALTAAIPEPATALLGVLGASLCGLCRRKQ